MSEIMKCDVCGKINIPLKIDVIAKRTWINSEQNIFTDWSTGMCPECYHKFVNWTEGKGSLYE